MQPDATPERDHATHEARLYAEAQGVRPPRAWRETLINAVVIVLGFALAWGLALLVLV